MFLKVLFGVALGLLCCSSTQAQNRQSIKNAPAARRTLAGAGFLGDWGSPDCEPASKHKTFSVNLAGQFVTTNTVGEDEGQPFVAVHVNENGPNKIVVTNVVGGMLMISTFAKRGATLTSSDVRFTDGRVFVEKAQFSRRSEGWRNEDLHFVRCLE
jgi:hypothetical protein